jgi:aspartyl-tRNA(Asn)/glutamyl-tRNA(Gln) amidotransferase subunit A
MSRARELDGRVSHRAGSLPPLFGVPVTIKDNVWMAEFPTTDGSSSFEGFVPMVNAEIVDRLLAAGCVPLGKTNLHEFALGVTATSGLGGPVRNPCDPSRVSGGSSGGSAVSVAMSKGPLLSIGSDTGGSVRIPAALCGVCGFKPSRGLLSTFGVFPLSPSLDHLGLMTKTVPDMSLAFGALTRAGRQRVRTSRIGVPDAYFTEDMDDTVSRNFHRALDLLKGGGSFDLKSVPIKENYAKYSRARATAMCKEASWFYEQVLTSPATKPRIHQDVLALMQGGLRTGMVRYMHSIGLMADATRSMSALLEGVDALVMPTCLIVAPKVEDVLGKETGRSRSLLLRNTELFNVSGLPALSVPMSEPSSRTPTALQIVGRHGADSQVLSIAEKVWALLRPARANR